MKTIGERIIFLRENIDLSQTNLADKIGITKMTLYKYEKNKCEPRCEVIANLANALNTSADFLVGLTSDYSPNIKNQEEEKEISKLNSLILKFRILNPINRAKVEERMDMLIESQNTDY